MHSGRSVLLVGLLLAATLAGCSGKSHAPSDGTAIASGPLVPVAQRHLEAFNVTGFYSHTLKAGPYAIGKGLSVDVPVALPATDGPDAATGGATMNLGLFLPQIPGCDWSKSDLPAACHVPVIADAGPYYASSTGNPVLNGRSCPEPVASVAGTCLVGEGDTVSTEPAHRLGKFLIDNFVPYGYAVAQVSVFGTGDSTSCEDLMGLSEQAGIDAVTTWLGTAPWSNGNVSYIGRSYDGSTPWEAATTGNPHLKTIVPISGLTGLYELMWNNGSAETRGAGELDAIYAAMTIDGEPADATQVECPDYATGPAEDAAAYATGGPDNVGPHNYFGDRSFFGRATQNFKGSVYLIHGLQDTNVDPHVSVPHIQEMQAHWPTKVLLGQWYHNYPDRPSEHVALPSGYGKEAYPYTVRYDWAQDLLEWFDHYLKGTGAQPVLDVEVQDNHGAWRFEDTYPPANGTDLQLKLGGDLAFSSGPQGQPVIAPASGTLGGTGAPTDVPVVYDGKPLAEDTRIAGFFHLPLQVTPAGPGGQVYAELQDVDATGKALHIGHAIMDLRYAAGGTSLQPVVPGVPLTAMMQSEPLDATVAAGHHLRLALTATGQDYLPSSTSAAVMVDGGTLHVPTEPHTVAGQFFTPPAWSGDAKATPAQP